MLRPLPFLLALLLGAPGLSPLARAQGAAPLGRERLQELNADAGVLRIALAALLDAAGRGPEGEPNAVQRARAQRLSGAIRRRARVLRRPGEATAAALLAVEADREELVGFLWRAVRHLEGAGRPADEVRDLAERWSGQPAATPAADPDDTLPDLDQLATRAWILRLARGAYSTNGDERGLLHLDQALRFADLQLEEASWSEQATALSMVPSPTRLAVLVERAAEHFDAAGEPRRARVCRRLVRFYRGEPQVEEPPLPDDGRPLTEEQERHLRVILAAREAHLLAGEAEGAALLDRLARDFRTSGTSELRPARILALLTRAAALHRAQGHPRHAENAEAVVAALRGPRTELEELRARVERLEEELARIRSRGR